jgi:hypothetical protein
VLISFVLVELVYVDICLNNSLLGYQFNSPFTISCRVNDSKEAMGKINRNVKKFAWHALF